MCIRDRAYPDLKANQNFLALQEELTSTESRVAYARQFYNDSVLGYHNQLDTFPTILIAKLGTFAHREFFEAEDSAKIPPTVKF
jgi:LemA protein